ncbi:HAD family phosphatase [Leisingera aquaemixtae]|uniref:HAD family hydrolase n=1 Tax=Leisingera aquaemixtae TaxID=1396826 RepID=UPI001C937E8C|nr:HAD family phosphatase [Leisingera aquaemixtae]MBY6067334.1 HAD family phosphatase [Leisingera aquaemixtae]
MPKTFPTPKLVIFDCDGVLVDSEPASNQAMADNLTRHGLPLTAEQSMQHFVGGTMAGVMQKARGLGANLPDNWIDEIYAETFARLRQGVPLTPGVSELLARLDAQGIPVCVASNGSVDKMRITLGQNGLWERFHPNAMFSAHSLGVSKPEPGLFLAAASHFGVQARDCLVIEDSGSGVTAAVRAGMRCLAFVPQGGGRKLAALGAEVFSDMAEVPALLSI